MSSEIDKTVLDDENLNKIIKTTGVRKPILSSKYISKLELDHKSIQEAISHFSLNNLQHIPNFLEKE